MLKIRALKNFTFLASAEAVSRLAGLALSIIVARHLGITAFGELAFASALTSYFLLFSDFGLSTLGTREVAKYPSQASRWGSHILAIQLILAVGLLLFLGIVVFILPMDFRLKIITFLFGMTILPSALNMSYLLQSQDRMLSASLAKSLTQIVYVAGAVLLLYFASDIIVLPFMQFLASVFGSLVVLALLRKYMHFRLQSLEKELLIDLVKSAWPFVFTAVLVQIYWNADSIILQFLLGTDQVGYYNAAYKIVILVFSVVSLANTAMFPSLSRLTSERQAYIRVLRKYSKYLGIVAIPTTLCGVVLSPSIIPLLYGSSFQPSVLPLQILSLYPLVKFLNITFEVTLITHGHIKKVTLGALVAALLNVGLCIPLIFIWGISGAAGATIIAEITSMAVMVWYYRKLMGYNNLLDYALRPLIASGFMVGAFFVFYSILPLVYLLLIGGVVYFVVLLLVGGIPKDDLKLAASRWPTLVNTIDRVLS